MACILQTYSILSQLSAFCLRKKENDIKKDKWKTETKRPDHCKQKELKQEKQERLTKGLVCIATSSLVHS